MAYLLSPIGNDQQCDANGNPLVGGKIYTYVAGSSTPAPTYTDNTSGTQQSNPIILNSLGLPSSPIWMISGVAVKYVIQDSTGVTIRTVDNVSGVNDVSSLSNSEWVASGLTPTYISASSFSFTGDQTAVFQVKRRILTSNTAGTVYASIVSAVFSTGITTITATTDSGVFDAGLSAVSYGLLSVTNPSVPAIYAKSGANSDITSLSAVTSINGGQLAGLRNRIINGDMRIDQRNNGTAVTPGIGSTYLVDRFFVYSTQASKLTFQQVADAPTGFKYSTRVSVASQFSPGVSDTFVFQQAIEGQNIVDLSFGTASAASVTVGFWVKGSVAGTYTVNIRNASGTRSYVGTVAVTSSWVKQSVTLVGDTTGTWATDNTAGLFLQFDLGSGANSNTTAGSWQAGNFTRTSGSVTFVNQTAGATLNITGVQLELGSTATTFEQRPYGMELALCQRYLPYTGYSTAVVGNVVSNVLVTASFAFPVTPRVPPTGISPVTLANTAVSAFSGAAGTPTAITFSSAGPSYGRVSATVTAGTPTLVGGNTCELIIGSGANILWTGCEL